MHNKKSAQQRQLIAHEAARIIATEGQYNYATAKRKAAERLGIRQARQPLPSNTEVEHELRAYQSLFGGDDHTETQMQLRKSALQAMLFFKPFKPKLVGPVLEGTAGPNSRITLHVFSDDPDEVLKFLYSQKLSFEQESRRIRWLNDYRTLDTLCVKHSEQLIELCLFNSIDQRQSPPCPVDGRPQRRATSTEVAYLIQQAEVQNDNQPRVSMGW